MGAPEEQVKKEPKISKRLLVIIVAVIVVGAAVATSYFLFFANQPPVAEFRAGVLNDRAVLNASASHDPDGSIVSYDWEFGDGATDSGLEVTHVYLAEGEFTVKLTVKDNAGASASTSRGILISLAPLPLFVAKADLLSVTVDASNAKALRGSLASYEWDWGDGNTASGIKADHTYASGGVYTIKLKVIDTNGVSSTSQQKVSVDPTSTIYTRMYDFCQPTFAKYWLIRRGTYGDKIITNTPPAVEEYPWGFDVPTIQNKDTALYCLYRIDTHGVNLPDYNMSVPVFFPYMASYDAVPNELATWNTTGEPLSDLQAEDDVTFDVGPGQTMAIDSFDVGGHSIERMWSAALEVRYSTEPGIAAGTLLRWSLEGRANDTLSIKIKDTNSPTNFTRDWITLSSATVSSWGVVGALNVSLKNPSTTASVHIDYVRIVVFYETIPPTTPQGEVRLDWNIGYATEESQAFWAKLGYIDTSGQDDGFITELNGTLTMDYNTSKRVFGVSGDPTTWWQRANAIGSKLSPLEAAWSNWLEWNANAKYDIYNGFEWFYQLFILELNGTVVQQGGANYTVVRFGNVAWGNEVLLSRWFYWGNASYMKEPGPDGKYDTLDDVPSTPQGWWGQEMGWWEHTTFNATIGTSFSFDLKGTMGYQMAAAADPGPDNQWKTGDDEPIWFWQAMLMDYVQNSSAHPRGEMRYYVDRGMTYLHNTPGSYVYGQEYQYDISLARWDLRTGETLVMELPLELMIWFDPVKSVWDPAGEGGKGAPSYSWYMAPLTLKRMEPSDVGIWEDLTKTLSMAGPRAMPSDGNPPAYGLPIITWKPVD